MRRALCVMLSVVIVSAASAVVAPAAQAAPAAKVGDCLADADVRGDDVDFSSTVSCDAPHEGQIIAVRKLPKPLAKAAYADLVRQGSAAYRDWTKAGYRLCAGTSIAKALWAKKGSALMKALGSPAVTVGPTTFIGASALTVGWNLPDKKSWQSGDRSLYCIAHAGGTPWTGDLRDLRTSKPATTLRSCFSSQGQPVPCDRPHDSEQLFTWYAKGFPRTDPNTMTDAEWAAWDKRCQAAADVLIGAKRTDIYGYADVDSGARNLTWGPHRDVSVMYCSVRKVAEEDLPPGTVVGLGSKALN